MTDLDKLKVCAQAVMLVPLKDRGDGKLHVMNLKRQVLHYDPREFSDQALELLCWLNKHGFLPEFDMDGLRFESSAGNSVVLFGDMTSPAALRRAIVDAVVKVKEGK